MRESALGLRILIRVFRALLPRERFARMRSRRVTAFLFTAPLLLATACGNAERMQPSALAVNKSLPPVEATINPAPSPPTSAAPAKPAATTAAAGETSAAADPGAGGGTEVKATIASQFLPPTLQVKVGSEVTWLNEGGIHTVTGGTDAPDPASPVGNHMLDTPGKTVKVKFDKPGTYDYFCVPHLSVGMKGQIVVA